MSSSPGRDPKRALGLALAAAAMLVSACATLGASPRPHREGMALTTHYQGGRHVWTEPEHVGLGTVLVWPVEHLFIRDEGVQLESVTPLGWPERVEFLGARASINKGPSAPVRLNGLPVSTCVTSWPPEGWGPTFDIEGLEVEPKDDIEIWVYALPPPGSWTIPGVEVVYRFGARRYRLVADSQEFSVDVKEEPREGRCPPLDPLLADLGPPQRWEETWPAAFKEAERRVAESIAEQEDDTAGS